MKFHGYSMGVYESFEIGFVQKSQWDKFPKQKWYCFETYLTGH